MSHSRLQPALLLLPAICLAGLGVALSGADASRLHRPGATAAERPASRPKTMELRDRHRGSQVTAGVRPDAHLLYERPFVPVLEAPTAPRRRAIGSDWVATPSGFVNVRELDAYPRFFREALDIERVGPDDVVLLHFGNLPMETIRKMLRRSGVVPLGEAPSNAFMVTGAGQETLRALADSGVTVCAWTPGFFVSPDIGRNPLPDARMAADPVLNLYASVFPGADPDRVSEQLADLGAEIEGTFNGLIAFSMHIDDLRRALDRLTGITIRALAERGFVTSAGEDTSTGIQTGEFRNGARPYTEWGIDGSTQVVGITDTGLSLDAAVLGSGAIGSAAGPPNPLPFPAGHRKVVAYVAASTLPLNPTGGGDLLTCDGTTGATHGHLVASLVAGNASDVVDDVRVLPGFDTPEGKAVTVHALDGVAPQARVYFIDDGTSALCVAPDQIEAQNPGILSANAAASRTFGTNNGLDLKIHNFSFSINSSESSYTLEAQDIDTWLHLNQDFLVVTAAGNRGIDANGDGNLDYGTVTSPGTAKNVLTLGTSGYPNEPLDPDDAIIPSFANQGPEMIPWSGYGGPSSGPAGVGQSAGWRIKPDVMAPGGETPGNQRLVAPTTCISSDDDNTGAVECLPMRAGSYSGTSFSAAAVSGAAALVRDYFKKGYAPGGRSGGATVSLTGPELKAAIIASGEMMTGNAAWDAMSASEGPGWWLDPGGQAYPGNLFPPAFYSPRLLHRFTPEQGYGRVQLNRLLPLGGDPDTPSFIQTELVSLNLEVVVSRTMNIVNPEEELRCVVSWYDKEATVAGPGAQGDLVRDVNLTLYDCGPDDVCASSDDIRYQGNYFSEDDNYDGVLLDVAEQYACSNDPGLSCDPGDFDPILDCGDFVATCDLISPTVTEDCNQNGFLDGSEFSLPVPYDGFPPDDCQTLGLDSSNNNEAVFLEPSQLTQSRVMRVDLEWVSSSEGAPPSTIDVGLVCSGGFIGVTTANRVRLNKTEFSCYDALEAIVLDGGEDATTNSVRDGVSIVSLDSLDATIDTEDYLPFAMDVPGTRFASLVAIRGSDAMPVMAGDQILSVKDGGRLEIIYTDPPTPEAIAGARVHCSPSLGLMNLVRNGTDARFDIIGGCDPRGRMDPRAVVFGLIPGTGLHRHGDLFLDAGEDLTYRVAITNREENVTLVDVEVRLTACVAGTIISDGTCWVDSRIHIIQPKQIIGWVEPGKSQVVAFNIHVDDSVSFPDQVEMVLEAEARKSGRPEPARFVFHHLLDADTWNYPHENSADSGASYYSTDFPTGGREIRTYAGEYYNPNNPMLDLEEFFFQDARTPVHGGGNDTLLGFNPATGSFDTPIANNWPWTFDLDDESWGQRRRFGSDPGDNLELQSHNQWQWSNTGECGFQTNDNTVHIDGPGGTGGIWHTGFAVSMAGTPPGRTGYDLGCENYDVPASPDPRREWVLDAVSSPVFFRVHDNWDSNGFRYTLEFLRLGANIQSDIGDENVIMAMELDPDVTTSQPVDPLDFGWLASDQGPVGFLHGPGPFAVFNPNVPFPPGTVKVCIGGPNDRKPCGSQPPTYCNPGACVWFVRDPLQGPGSPGPFFDPNDPNKWPTRPFGPTWFFAGVPERRTLAGLPLRNYDYGLNELRSVTFEDIFGPNETPDPAQTYPITGANPELLINRRDMFQVNFNALLRESVIPGYPTIPAYGWGFDDVVVEWRELHPVADRTPCSDPGSWNSLTIGKEEPGPLSGNSDLAAGCASISWDRNLIQEPETTLKLQIIDSNAQYGPGGIAGYGDEQAKDDDANGFSEMFVRVNSDVDPEGELFMVEQIEIASRVYEGMVRVSATRGLVSASDGVIFIQENGDGSNPVAVNAYHDDWDIAVAGTPPGNVPCPDNPLVATAITQFSGARVQFVTALVTDQGPNAEPDGIADPLETVRLDISVVNEMLDEARGKPTLTDVSIHLLAASHRVGSDSPIACILDGSSYYDVLQPGVARFNDPSDPFLFVVGDVSRASVSEVLQADFILSIEGKYVNSQGVEENFSSFSTPQRFSLNLDLDKLAPAPPSLESDHACVGGPNAGRACTMGIECPSGSCDPLPAYLRTGGSSYTAGHVGYFEGFEGAASMGGRESGFTAGPWPDEIEGTSFIHSPAVNENGGYLDGGMMGNYLDSLHPGPLTPGADPGNDPDEPEGSSAVDGLRCQYNDPQGPSKHMRGENHCRPWDGSDWHVNPAKAFSGAKGLYYGVDGVRDLGQTPDWDNYHTNSLAAAVSGVLNVGVSGNATLSIYQIAQAADYRAFSLPAAQAADRAYVMAVEVDPATGIPIGHWERLTAFQNNYSSLSLAPGFVNCMFQSYDAHYDAEVALGHTPGWNPAAHSPEGVTYNADDISSEDDYFDPNDPLRLLGPSEGCYPEYVFSAMGDHTSTDTAHAGRAFTDGELGTTGSGVWVNSLFNLDSWGGKSIRLRFVFSGMDIYPGIMWADILGPDTTNATRGWRLDDVAVSGLVEFPILLVPDVRVPVYPSACPEVACNVVAAEAGPDMVVLAPTELVFVDGSDSSADICVDGFLEYRWRIGGVVQQDYSTNPVYTDIPLITTAYTLDVRCSTRPECMDTDTILVIPAEEMEISGLPSSMGIVELIGSPPTQLARTTWWTLPVSQPVTAYLLGVDIKHDGIELRDLGGAPPSGANLADRLRGQLCQLESDSPVLGQFTLDDSILEIDLDEIVGYLAVGASTYTGVFGTLGQGEEPGIPANGFSRGRTAADALPACTP